MSFFDRPRYLGKAPGEKTEDEVWADYESLALSLRHVLEPWGLSRYADGVADVMEPSEWVDPGEMSPVGRTTLARYVKATHWKAEHLESVDDILGLLDGLDLFRVSVCTVPPRSRDETLAVACVQDEMGALTCVEYAFDARKDQVDEPAVRNAPECRLKGRRKRTRGDVGGFDIEM